MSRLFGRGDIPDSVNFARSLDTLLLPREMLLDLRAQGMLGLGNLFEKCQQHDLMCFIFTDGRGDFTGLRIAHAHYASNCQIRERLVARANFTQRAVRGIDP